MSANRVARPASIEGAFADLSQRVANIERLPGGLTASSRVGSSTFGAAEEKALGSGPELTVATAGAYEVGLSIRGRTNAAGLVELVAGPSVNGAALTVLFNFVALGQFALAMGTNYEAMTLKEGDVITVHVKILQAVSCTFDLARLTLQRTA